MISDSDAQKCMGFLEVVRTMIDNAEVEIASATRSKIPPTLLLKALAMVKVGYQNIVWVEQELDRIVRQMAIEDNNASAADRPTAGNAVEPTQQTSSDKLPV